jgi:hypothetical protein
MTWNTRHSLYDVKVKIMKTNLQYHIHEGHNVVGSTELNTENCVSTIRLKNMEYKSVINN